VRLAIFSDVHSNLEATDAVIARAREERATSTIVLGDVVGYGADPDAVVARLRALPGAVLLAGNHDLAATGRFDLGWFNRTARAALDWTTAVMAAETRALLETLEPRRDTAGAVLVHGSIVDPAAEYVVHVEDAMTSFRAEGFALCFFGHTHQPALFAERDGRVRGATLGDGEVVRLEGARFMLNPGSVGQPRDGDPRAAFMIYDTEAATAVVHRVPYDVRSAQEKIQAAGLPIRLALRLALGH
jgi:predicted phosphodiesterase